ncbi:Fc.00g040100.m01.CDS01 [Cosmosporella sp. VM-42]
MGAVVSCIQGLFRAIGNGIMAVISGVGNILHGLISAIVSFFGILVTFFTCGYCGGKRRAGHSRRAKRSTI